MTMEDTKLLQLDNVTCTERVIGQGAYGRVLEVSVLCAAKEIHHALVDFSSPQGFTTLKQKFLQECARCSVLCHPNIVHFQGIYHPRKSTKLPWLVMEKMDYSLKQYLQSHEPTTVSFQIKMSILHDVSLGLQYLHAQDIIHRDLSSNNVLLNKELVAKIADLGVAKAIDPNHAKSATQAPGTVIFMPPEALSVNPRYGKPVDVFSFGCVTIHTMSHIWPVPKDETYLDEVTGKKLVLTEVERREHYLTNIQVSIQLKELILLCLQDLPKRRPSVNDICKAIREMQPDLKVSKIQSILLNYEPLLGEKERLTKELDRLNDKLAAANKSIDHHKHLHQMAKQQADSYQSDLCKAKEALKNKETMLSTCKEDFEQERKDYEGQLQIMRNEIRQLKEQCQEKLHSAPKAMENQNQIAMQTPDTQKVKEACSERRMQSDNPVLRRLGTYETLPKRKNYSPYNSVDSDIFMEPKGTVQASDLIDTESKDPMSRGNLTTKSHWDSMKALDDVVDDPDMFIAKHDFAPIGPGQLSLKEGDKILVKRYNDVGDWCEGETDSGAIGWIPTSYVDKLDSLKEHSWYHGSVSREEAEHRLCSGVNGSFLIRESVSRAGQYSLSLKYNGRTHHYKISSGKDRYYIYPEAKFTTLRLLVHHHSILSDKLFTTLDYPAVNPTKLPANSLSHEADKWEVERSDLKLVIGVKIGTGRYSEVYQAEFKEKTVAVKAFKKDISVEGFLKEALVMKRIKHPHLVQLLGVCTQQIPFFIITEFMEKGNLLHFIQGPDGADLQLVTLGNMWQQIAGGMACLEKCNIIHRDLAARNCLVGKNHLVKVADFGMSRLLDAEIYEARAGTEFPIKWTAPEALAYNKFSIKSDVWSFGILLWELTTHGMSPYPDVKLPQIYDELAKGYRLNRPDGCPENIYSLMRKCWSWKENDRPTFKEIYRELCQLSNVSGAPPRSTVVQLEPTKSALVMPQSKIPPQTSRVTPRKNTIPFPAGQPTRQTRPNTVAVSSSIASSISQDLTDFNTLKPISDDPSHVVEEIARISANLLDISLKGFTEFKRSLEYFAQLSEKMLQLIQAQNTNHLASTRIAIGILREKIEDFRNLLRQINSSLSCDYNSQIETFVNSISKSCRDLYGKLYSKK